jgi:hypothetical protein
MSAPVGGFQSCRPLQKVVMLAVGCQHGMMVIGMCWRVVMLSSDTISITSSCAAGLWLVHVALQATISQPTVQ